MSGGTEYRAAAAARMLVFAPMPVTALTVWLRVQALTWLPGCIALPWLVPAAWWAPLQAILLAASYLALVKILRTGRSAADVVTIARFVMIVMLVVEGAASFGLQWWGVAVAAVLLDLVDGAVARRYGGSAEGAILDMETDQFTVLALSSLIVRHGGGPHVLVLPAMRYAFVLAMWWAGAPAHDPKPVDGDNRRGKRICALVMVLLLVALLPGVPPMVRDGGVLVAVLLLAWSFAADAKFLVARVRPAKGAG